MHHMNFTSGQPTRSPVAATLAAADRLEGESAQTKSIEWGR